MPIKTFLAAAATLALLSHAQAQTQPQPPGATSGTVKAPAQQADAAKPAQAKCRNVPLYRSDAKVTREDVIAELQRARREGELDWYISGNPPAVQRRPCMPAEGGVGG